MSDELRVVDRDGVRWIEIDRPAVKNGLTVNLNRQIMAAFEHVEQDEALRCVVLTGANGSFCSGLDLKDAMKSGPKAPELTDENIRLYFHALIKAVRYSTRPTIAAVDGVAVGFGCDLALACDIRLLSDRARFGEVFVRRGLMPDGGSTFMLPRLVGVGRALELMLTGEIVDAQEAVRIGLANRIVPAAEFHEVVWAYAARIAKGPPLAQRAIKRAVAAALGSTLDQALDCEREGQIQLLQSADFVEGVAAFLEKREPVFKGE